MGNCKIELASFLTCTGCSACRNICPRNAIRMKRNEEGFEYPVIDPDLCIECRLCQRVCPEIIPSTEEKEEYPRTFALWSLEDRKKSSSGGAFSAFARYVLQQGGMVAGAAFDEHLQLRHRVITNVEDLSLLRGSKYLQSSIGEVFRQIKQALKEKRWVLFCGTPCQVSGLYRYLGNMRKNECLITLDLVCHGVPSQKAFDAYIQKIQKVTSGIPCGFSFRQPDGWYYRSVVKFTDGRKKILRYDQNVYMPAFFRGYFHRECCFRCRYARLPRQGDFTLADFWGLGNHGVPFRKNKSAGVSLVLANSSRSVGILQEIAPTIFCEERSLQEALKENTQLKESLPRPEERDTVYRNWLDERISLKEFGEKYHLLPERNLSYHVLSLGREIGLKLGVFHVLKDWYHYLKSKR